VSTPLKEGAVAPSASYRVTYPSRRRADVNGGRRFPPRARRLPSSGLVISHTLAFACRRLQRSGRRSVTMDGIVRFWCVCVCTSVPLVLPWGSFCASPPGRDTVSGLVADDTFPRELRDFVSCRHMSQNGARRDARCENAVAAAISGRTGIVQRETRPIQRRTGEARAAQL
jgi:hypothetical protein